MKSLQQHINERLVLSKNKSSITDEDFYDALNSYSGEYEYGKGGLYATFNLKKYCVDNNIDSLFDCLDDDDNVFSADWILVKDKDGITIEVIGEDERGIDLSYVFDDFDDFVKYVLDRDGDRRIDPITGEEHLQNIYNILIGKQ